MSVKKRNQTQVAKQAGMLVTFLSNIINRTKKCPPERATILMSITGIDRVIWVWGTKAEMRMAWDLYVKNGKVCNHNEQFSTTLENVNAQ